MTEQCTPKFLQLVRTIKEGVWKYPELKPYVLAQMLLECGRGSTKLFSLYNNPMGMHYHDFLSDLAVGVTYEACDGPGLYASFFSFDAVITAYFRWFSHWPHYGNWGEHAHDGKAFLEHIGPFYCPPGFTPEWIKAHGGLNYAQYICQKLLPEAKALLNGASLPTPNPASGATWFRFQGSPEQVIAFNGMDVVDTLDGNSVDELVAFFAKHRKAKTWKVARAP